TAFDSFSSSVTWRNFADGLARSIHAVPVSVSLTALRTIGMLVFIAVVATTFSLAARATGGLDREQRRALPGQLAHSLIPIVVGYIFAHYLSYLVERGQQAVFALADPLGKGLEPAGAGAFTHCLCAFAASHGVGSHQGDVRGHRTHRGGDRGARQSVAAAAVRPPTHRPADHDAGHGRLHLHWVVLALQRVGQSRPVIAGRQLSSVSHLLAEEALC
ncbi:MAG: hypothetical protein QOI79_2869, partial [Mycobacterium sp.]|nr:hypothetical protein [Mycobacterium sp.]